MKDERGNGWLGKSSEENIMILKITKLQWSPYHFTSGPKNVFMLNHKRPRLYMRVRWNLNFIRECTKINKIRSKLYLWKKIQIKMTQLVFVLSVFRSVLFWSHLEAVLSFFRFRVVLKNFNELPYGAWGASGSMCFSWVFLLTLYPEFAKFEGFGILPQNRGEIRDSKVCGGWGCQTTIRITGLREILGRDEGIREHYWGTSIEWDRNYTRRAIIKS